MPLSSTQPQSLELWLQSGCVDMMHAALLYEMIFMHRHTLHLVDMACGLVYLGKNWKPWRKDESQIPL